MGAELKSGTLLALVLFAATLSGFSQNLVNSVAYIGSVNPVAAPAAGFSPANLSNLKVWFDATTLTNTYSDKQTIDTWTDSSGNNNHAGKNNCANPPIFVASGINSRPSVRFIPPGSSYLAISNSISTRPLSIFMVLCPTNNDGTGGKVMLSRYGNYCVYIDISGAANTITVYDAINNNTTVGGAYLANTPFLLSVTHANTGFPNIYTNGVFIQIGTTNSSSSSSGLTGSGAFPNYLGVFQPGSNPFNNFISEVIVYGDVKNDTDRGSVEQYLKSKWGL